MPASILDIDSKKLKEELQALICENNQLKETNQSLTKNHLSLAEDHQLLTKNHLSLSEDHQLLTKRSEWLETELAIAKYNQRLLRDALYGKKSEKFKESLSKSTKNVPVNCTKNVPVATNFF